MNTNELKRLVSLLPSNLDTIEGVSENFISKSLMNLVLDKWHERTEELEVYAQEPKLGVWYRASNFILQRPDYLQSSDRYVIKDILTELVQMVFEMEWFENIDHLIWMYEALGLYGSMPELELLKKEHVSEIVIQYWWYDNVFSIYLQGRYCGFFGPLPWKSCLELVRVMKTSTSGIDSSKVWSLYSKEEWTNDYLIEVVNLGCKGEFFIEALERDLDISPDFNLAKSINTVEKAVREWPNLNQWQKEVIYTNLGRSTSYVPIGSLPLNLSPLNIALLENGVVDSLVFDMDVLFSGNACD